VIDDFKGFVTRVTLLVESYLPRLYGHKATDLSLKGDKLEKQPRANASVRPLAGVNSPDAENASSRSLGETALIVTARRFDLLRMRQVGVDTHCATRVLETVVPGL